jgi:hypothetical protein
MSVVAGQGTSYESGFEAYGVRIVVRADDPDLLARLTAELPPGSTPCPHDSAEVRFGLRRDDELGYVISSPDEADIPCRDLELAVSTVAMQIRWHVALHAQGRIFIHAGVVAKGGQALLLPGQSFAGKTTLVAALVEAGATYYSDEFAVLDATGRVHPYPHALTIRGANGEASRSAESFGGSSGKTPIPVALLAITTYEASAEWDPAVRSVGQGMVALMSYAVPLHERPGETFAALRRALSGARVLEGPRGEAETAAASLLEQLE